ncbi:MAG: gamma-glutamylcyclotransferase [Bacteroidales bacterium]
MCIIIVKPYGQKIKEEVLTQSYEENNDGFGFHAYKDGERKVYRTNEYKDFKPVLDKYNNEDTFLVVHYRLTSAGNNHKKNVHPFPIRNDWWLFHNGHFMYADYHKHKSDTNIITDALKKIDIDKNITGLTELMLNLTDSRLVFVKNDEYHIVNEDMGVWINNIWYSQDSPTKTIPLFVYGTLKRGGSNHSYYLSNAKSLGSATTNQKYGIRIEGVPKLTKEEYDWIDGELYMVNEEELEEIDALEGHPHFYQREKIFVSNWNKTYEAWAYFLDERRGTLTDKYIPYSKNYWDKYYGYDPYYNPRDFNDYIAKEEEEEYENYDYATNNMKLEEIDNYYLMCKEYNKIYGRDFPSRDARMIYQLYGYTGSLVEEWEDLLPEERRMILDEVENGTLQWIQ